MPFKLVAIDLDGTLINEKLQIADADAAAIGRALGRGLKITLATGRLFAAARPFAAALRAYGPLIALNGAAIYALDDTHDELLHSTPLKRDIGLRAYDALKAADFHVQLYFNDRLYLDAMNERAQLYLRLSRVDPIMVPDLRVLLTTSPPREPGPMKVLGVASPEAVLAFIPVLSAQLGPSANVFRSQPPFLEVTDPKADKGSALRWVANQLGIAPAEIAAIGDSDNDVPMFEAAGASFAVSGATPKATAAASRVVAGVDQGGVAEALGYVLDDLARQYS